MATKNLARTIIEGGRASPNKRERMDSHREERAATRAFLVRASALEEGFDALCVAKRSKVYKGFADKLGPPERWLRSQVGRPWSKVRSEMFARFNPRSLAGQHIIFDHLLTSVAMDHAHDRQFGSRADLFVDRHGTLRCLKPRKRSRLRCWRTPQPIPDHVLQWLQDRRVCGEDSALFWQVQTRSCGCCCAAQRSPCCCPGIDGVVQHGAHLHYRQAQRLTRDEVEFWLSLDKDLRERAGGIAG